MDNPKKTTIVELVRQINNNQLMFEQQHKILQKELEEYQQEKIMEELQVLLTFIEQLGPKPLRRILVKNIYAEYNLNGFYITISRSNTFASVTWKGIEYCFYDKARWRCPTFNTDKDLDQYLTELKQAIEDFIQFICKIVKETYEIIKLYEKEVKKNVL